MNIDELRSQWQSLDVDPDRAALHKAVRRIAQRDAESLRSRYYKLCLRMIGMSAFGIAVSVPFGRTAPTLMWCSFAFFILMAVFHIIQAVMAHNLDFGRLSVRRSIEAVCDLERMRVIKRAVGIALGVPLLVYMCIVVSDAYGPYTVYGCVCGAVIGLVIGLIINHNATTLLRRMKEDLGDEQ